MAKTSRNLLMNYLEGEDTIPWGREANVKHLAGGVRRECHIPSGDFIHQQPPYEPSVSKPRTKRKELGRAPTNARPSTWPGSATKMAAKLRKRSYLRKEIAARLRSWGLGGCGQAIGGMFGGVGQQMVEFVGHHAAEREPEGLLPVFGGSIRRGFGGPGSHWTLAEGRRASHLARGSKRGLPAHGVYAGSGKLKPALLHRNSPPQQWTQPGRGCWLSALQVEFVSRRSA